MEEQKETKEVKMDVENTSSEKQQKLTYEQLNDACNQLWQQNQQLIKKCRELEQFSMFRRLDYLFKVLEHSSVFDSNFLVSCAEEIKEAMTIPENTEEPKEQ